MNKALDGAFHHCYHCGQQSTRIIRGEYGRDIHVCARCWAIILDARRAIRLFRAAKKSMQAAA